MLQAVPRRRVYIQGIFLAKCWRIRASRNPSRFFKTEANPRNSIRLARSQNRSDTAPYLTNQRFVFISLSKPAPGASRKKRGCFLPIHTVPVPEQVSRREPRAR